MTRVVRVYCAGKIRKGHRWPPSPYAGGGDDWRSANENGLPLSISVPGVDVIYTGPFSYSCDHGCSHGPTSHGNALGRDNSCQESCGDGAAEGFHRRNGRITVFWRSLRQIGRADLVIAKPEADSYGTLVEIGWAAKADKSIVIDLNGQPPEIANELWFAAEAHGCTDPVLEDVAIAILGYGPERWGPHATPADRPDPNEALCESPIEVSLYRAMRLVGLSPAPQVQIDRYRADFVLDRLIVECDGHDFHSSREQRTRDAGRDRFLMAAGYQVIRFTGTEIHRDAVKCANEVKRLAASV